MNNLLLYSLIIAGIMYIIYQQTKPAKSTSTKAIQTEISDNQNNPELEHALDELITNIKKLNSEI